MSRRPAPLPSRFTGRPFSVAEGRAVLGDGRLRAPDLDRPFHGVRRDTPATDLAERCRSFLVAAPPDAFFCFSTAAALWNMPLPIRLDRDPRLHVAFPAPRRAPKGEGVVGHKLVVPSERLRRIHGIPVTAVERTWCDLSAQVTVAELVAAGDFLINWQRPVASVQRLADAAARHGARRGARTLAAALPLLHDRSDSPQETALRLLLLERGLGPLAVNLEIPAPGRRPYRVDLAVVDARVAIEYQGSSHFEPRQRRRDLARFARLRELGWEVIEVFADDLVRPAELVTRINGILMARRRELAAGLGRVEGSQYVAMGRE